MVAYAWNPSRNIPNLRWHGYTIRPVSKKKKIAEARQVEFESEITLRVQIQNVYDYKPLSS